MQQAAKPMGGGDSSGTAIGRVAFVTCIPTIPPTSSKSMCTLGLRSLLRKARGDLMPRMVVSSDSQSTNPAETLQDDSRGSDSARDQRKKIDVLQDYPKIFEEKQKWILFSDLHVRKQSVETCVRVLQFVHEQAIERHAGVAFLGDFWHSRGNLPVEPLNAILDEFSKWKTPVIMIPGNHDQVSLDGEINALDTLGHAIGRDKSLIFSRPTIFLNALWMPYRRSEQEFREITSSDLSMVQAIFCHVDVYGARTNQGVKSTDGMHSDNLFPRHCDVFSGHFHRPQVVPGTRIRYVGSPYQVSFAEANEDKNLVVLDKEWLAIEKIPIDLGPRHFRLHPLHPDFHIIMDSIRAEDRVEIEAESEEEVRSVITRVTSKGGRIKVRQRPRAQSKPRIEKVESLSLEGVFAQFSKLKGLDDETYEKGSSTISSYLSEASNSDTVLDTVGSRFNFEHLELIGFGPFKNAVECSLLNRGIILVVGENIDPSGWNSNGAGKSTLIMAPLWCLTGHTDSRPEGTKTSGLTTEMLNEMSSSGFVKVTGSLDGKPLEVVRRLQRRGKKTEMSLAVCLDGKDLTKQTRDETQALLETLLSASLLSRTTFFGQHLATRSALEFTDKALKDELAKIIPLDRWRGLKDYCNSLKKESKLAAEKSKAVEDELLSDLIQNEEQLEQAKLEIEETKEKYNDQIRSLELEREALQKRKQEASIEPQEAKRLVTDIEQYQEELRGVENEVRNREAEALRANASLETTLQEIAALERKMQIGIQTLTLAEEWERERREEVLRKRAELASVSNQTCDVGGRRERLRDVRQRLDSALASTEEIENAEELQLKQKLDEVKTARAELGKERSRVDAVVTSLRSRLAEAMPAAESEDGVVRICDRCFQPVDSRTFQEQRSLLKHDLEHSTLHQSDIMREMSNLNVAASTIQEAISSRRETAARRSSASIQALLREERTVLDELATAEATLKKVENLEAELEKLMRMKNPNFEAVVNFFDLPDEIRNSLNSTEVLHRACEEKANATKFAMEEAAREKEDHIAGIHSRLQEIKEKARLVAAELAEAEIRQYKLTVRAEQVEDLKREEKRIELQLLREEADFNKSSLFVKSIEERVASRKARLDELRVIQRKSDEDARIFEQLEEAFGVRGAQSFVLEGALSELEQSTQTYLGDICDGSMMLQLSPYRALLTKKDEGVERIEKTVLVRSTEGEYVKRGIRQLSGGQRHRISMAFSLAFMDLVERRRGPRTNMLVLDEALVHLDMEGKERVAKVISSIGKETIIFVAQDISEDIAAMASSVETVRRDGDESKLHNDGELR